jgi:GNAT superfamily N-acetyltransferase
VPGAIGLVPPGRYPLPLGRFLRYAAGLVWRLPSGGIPLGRVVRALQAQRLIDRLHIREPHWYVSVLGVHPDHQGKGLGDRFLRHIERTKVLAYLVGLDTKDPQRDYDALRAEVRAYSADLAERPHIVVLTKSDLLSPDAEQPRVVAPQAERIVTISAVAQHGLQDLLEALWQLLEQARGAATEEPVRLP